MPVLAVDLGGTKLATAVFSEEGELLCREQIPVDGRTGSEVGQLIGTQVKKHLSADQTKDQEISSIGISVPGIYHSHEGRVWAPNIPGWENYPLLEEIRAAAPHALVHIDSDRACYILGESWKGRAKDCPDAIFLAVGTGIGAGILCGGKILRGASDIAGAIGWMALDPPFDDSYRGCGCFESTASGEGIVKLARKMATGQNGYTGMLKRSKELTSADVFDAWQNKDVVAMEVIRHCIQAWGMAIANLVSLFNPQKIIMGGGVFGPAVQLIPAIYEEARQWAQPISMQQVTIEPSALGSDAGLFGAACLALQSVQPLNTCP